MSPAAQVSLELRDISFSYGNQNRHESSFSLAHCNLTARAGEPLGVLGPSGAGKSTLLSVTAGHLVPTTGAVTLGGRDITRIRAGLRRIVTVFQEDSLFPNLSVEQNVAYGIAPFQRFSQSAVASRVEHYLRRFGVYHHRRHSPAALSVGEKQRVALCRALIAESVVLLLDEPTSSLDCIQRDVLMALLRETIKSEKDRVFVIVSHDRDFVFDLCPTIAVLDKGRLLCQSAASDLLAAPPSRRIAEILGGHYILDGEFESASIFRLSGADGVAIPIQPTGCHAPVERSCSILIRKSEVSLDNGPHLSPSQISGRIVGVTPTALCSLVEVEIGQQIKIQIPRVGAQRQEYSVGDSVSLCVASTAIHLVERFVESTGSAEALLSAGRRN